MLSPATSKHTTHQLERSRGGTGSRSRLGCTHSGEVLLEWKGAVGERSLYLRARGLQFGLQHIKLCPFERRGGWGVSGPRSAPLKPAVAANDQPPRRRLAGPSEHLHRFSIVCKSSWAAGGTARALWPPAASWGDVALGGCQGCQAGALVARRPAAAPTWREGLIVGDQGSWQQAGTLACGSLRADCCQRQLRGQPACLPRCPAI